MFKNSKPKYVEFEFTAFDGWQKDTAADPDIAVTYSALLASTTAPRIEGTITNQSLQDIPDLELVTFVLDGKENVVAASRTFVEELAKKTTQSFVFTWPKPFDLGVEACADTLDVALILDRSGSMKSESVNPPEPFNTVKSTAQSFINALSDEDQVSVFSFGNSGVMESALSSDKNIANQAIENLVLGTTSEQTNITDGLLRASNELASGHAQAANKKVIVLLTDGAPTEPKMKDIPDYPKISAETLAKNILASSTTIYTIGLGKNVNEGFLKNISGDETRYFFAPTKETLSGIYKSIGTSLCERKANVITVMYRIP